MKPTHVWRSALAPPPHASCLLCIIWSNRNTGKNYNVSSTLRYVIPITQNYIAQVACRSWSTQQHSAGIGWSNSMCKNLYKCYCMNCCLPDGCSVLTTRMVEHLPHIFCSKNFTLQISEGKGQAKEQKSRSTKTLLLAELEKGIYKNLLYMIAIGQLRVVKLKRLNPCTWTLKFSWTYKVPHPPTTIIYTKQVQFQLNCGRKPQLR